MDDQRSAAISGPVLAHTDIPLPAGPVGVRPTFRDPALQSRFRADGFAVVPFLDEDTITTIHDICLRVGPAPGDEQTGYFPGNVSDSPEWKRQVIAAVTPLVEARIEALFDRHHIFHLTFMTKWPGPAGKLQVHQDPTMVDHEGRFRSVNVWCPLTLPAPGDDRERGMVRVVPGSTHLPTAGWYRARGGHVPSGLESSEDILYERVAEPVATELGEAIVLDHRLVHCSPPNESDEPRHILAVGLRPTESPSVHVECDDEGWVDFYTVDDEYFIRHPHVDMADYPRTRHLQRRPFTEVSAADLEATVGFTMATPMVPAGSEAASEAAPEAVLPRAANRQAAPAAPQPRDWARSVTSWRGQFSWQHWLPARWAPPPRGPSPVLGDPVLDHRLRRDGFLHTTLLDPAEAESLRHLLSQDPSAGARAVATALAERLPERLVGHHLVRGSVAAVAPWGTRGVQRAWMFTDEPAGIRSFVVWLALDHDHTAGALQVARGSHRLDTMLRGTNLTASWLAHAEVWPARLLTIPMGPGDLVVADAALVHAFRPCGPGPEPLRFGAVVVPDDEPLLHYRRVDDGHAARHELPPAFFADRGLVAVARAEVEAGTRLPIGEVHLGPKGLARRLDSQPLALLDRARLLRRPG